MLQVLTEACLLIPIIPTSPTTPTTPAVLIPRTVLAMLQVPTEAWLERPAQYKVYSPAAGLEKGHRLMRCVLANFKPAREDAVRQVQCA